MNEQEIKTQKLIRLYPHQNWNNELLQKEMDLLKFIVDTVPSARFFIEDGGFYITYTSSNEINAEWIERKVDERFADYVEHNGEQLMMRIYNLRFYKAIPGKLRHRMNEEIANMLESQT